MAASAYRPSYVSKLIKQLGEDEDGQMCNEDEEAVIWTAASLYGAAADTAVITLNAFTLAMVQFPKVQRKAQEEIDRVIGTDRLPTFDDRENLPYVNALVKEALRWWPIVPMSFPHTATDDFEFSGYHIPKGAIILPSIWWFMKDPEIYTSPEEFEPERFLAPRNEPDPTEEVFGYGRRVCPGRFFADASLYLNMAQTLATFNLSKTLDKDRKETTLDVKMKPGVLAYPTEFKFKAAPRSKRHVELIRRLEVKYPFEPSDSSLLESTDDFDVRY
ncbi:O-methylsterigmatocystin oxidoreductase [Colletotrichum truncatum]|uniref:O-methylsterigmatocystin oxidoreductase n=1 Tax=Colletotrichum truncatum TaxID=5467 RepID=A0ACC3YFP3_COLTU|nr:O-methylsterigmatocystin oxidoreductase [Colletotrichum truncatum]KAF6788391.1 O-methylsterigmatocystin oxidoreductase [Colletotrichum truncatum]